MTTKLGSVYRHPGLGRALSAWLAGDKEAGNE